MRNPLLKTIALLALTAGLLFITFPAVAAETMTYLEYRQVFPKVDPDSFKGQPRKLWRVGKEKMRLEEPHNPATNLKGLAIISIPDIWMINRATRTGRHSKDTNPIRIPIFPPMEGAPWVPKLEFGEEIAFFRDQIAETSLKENVGGRVMDRYRIRRDGVDLILFVDSEKQVPIRVMMRVGEKALGIHYTKYRSGLKPNDTLFQPPAKIKWQKSAPK